VISDDARQEIVAGSSKPSGTFLIKCAPESFLLTHRSETRPAGFVTLVRCAATTVRGLNQKDDRPQMIVDETDSEKRWQDLLITTQVAELISISLS
jgi:hypothetical protein